MTYLLSDLRQVKTESLHSCMQKTSCTVTILYGKFILGIDNLQLLSTTLEKSSLLNNLSLMSGFYLKLKNF